MFLGEISMLVRQDSVLAEKEEKFERKGSAKPEGLLVRVKNMQQTSFAAMCGFATI